MLLISVLVVFVGLRGPWRILPLTNGPDDPKDELLESFCWNCIATGGEVRFPIDAEAQRDDRGRKIATMVSTREEIAGAVVRYGSMENTAKVC